MQRKLLGRLAHSDLTRGALKRLAGCATLDEIGGAAQHEFRFLGDKVAFTAYHLTLPAVVLAKLLQESHGHSIPVSLISVKWFISQVTAR